VLLLLPKIDNFAQTINQKEEIMNSPRVRQAFTVGLPFGLAMGAFFFWRFGLIRGVAGGVFTGILFGTLITLFTEAQRKKLEITDKLFEGYPLLHQGPANHWLGAESRGGWLVLTSHQLSFRSHGENIQNSGLTLTIEELQSVRTKRTLGIIPNGLLVEKKSGGSESFLVSNNTTWEAKIAEAIKANPQPYRV
jgi:hypothetical protein